MSPTKNLDAKLTPSALEKLIDQDDYFLANPASMHWEKAPEDKDKKYEPREEPSIILENEVEEDLDGPIHTQVQKLKK